MSIATQRQNLLFVFSAPSGCGKSTICEALLSSDAGLVFSLSSTTRAPRPGDVEGETYDFTTREQFEQLRDDGVFFESAEVHGNLYGTRRDLIERQLDNGLDVILDIDVQGALMVTERSDRAVLIFILPPSMEELADRLRGRGSDEEDVIEQRLVNARGEIAQAGLFDYVVTNDSLERAIDEVRAIIAAERRRVGRLRIVCKGEGELDAIYPVD